MAATLLALGAGLLATVVTMPAVMALLRRLHILDVPNERSSHVRPTLRGGGLGVAAGVLTGVAVGLVVAGERVDATITALVLVPLGLGVLGFADDVRSLGVGPRMLCQLVLGAVGTGLLLWGSHLEPLVVGIAVLGGAVWVSGLLNATNFMDGINGVTALTTAVIGGSQAVVGVVVDAPAVAVTGAAIAGAALGFLPYNLPRAVLFLGDSGSYLIGSLLALNALGALQDGAPVLALVAPFAIVLGDTSATLLRRLAAGERWWTPHRGHVYQRVALGRLGHTRTAVLVGALTATCAGAGLVVLRIDEPLVAVLVTAVVAAVLAGYLALPGRILRTDGGPGEPVGPASASGAARLPERVPEGSRGHR